jgi:hypothetical protein
MVARAEFCVWQEMLIGQSLPSPAVNVRTWAFGFHFPHSKAIRCRQDKVQAHRFDISGANGVHGRHGDHGRNGESGHSGSNGSSGGGNGSHGGNGGHGQAGARAFTSAALVFCGWRCGLRFLFLVFARSFCSSGC